MAMYDYPDDGRFHTRYSEIVQCGTLKQAMEVAKKRLNIKDRYENDILRFGQTRHEMWDEESKQTGKTPACFADHLGVQWHTLETEVHRATELFDGVVIHFTTDAVVMLSDFEKGIQDAVSKLGQADVVDYKTATGLRTDYYTKHYQSQLQLPSYAMLLRPHGIIVKNGHYLIEAWDKERKNLQGYMYVPRPISLQDMANAKNMFKKGVENLLAAERAVKKEFGL